MQEPSTELVPTPATWREMKGFDQYGTPPAPRPWLPLVWSFDDLEQKYMDEIEAMNGTSHVRSERAVHHLLKSVRLIRQSYMNRKGVEAEDMFTAIPQFLAKPKAA